MSADGSRVVGLGVSGGAPEWSPDGTRIAFHAGGDVQVAHVTGDLQVLRVDRVTAGRSPTWSPDGARLAFASGGEVWAVDVAAGTSERLLVGASQPAWSPSGRRLAYRTGGDVRALELATGASSTPGGSRSPAAASST